MKKLIFSFFFTFFVLHGIGATAEQLYQIFIIGDDLSKDLTNVGNSVDLSAKPITVCGSFESSELKAPVLYHNINFKTPEDAKLFFDEFCKDEEKPGVPSTEFNYPGYCSFNFELLKKLFRKEYNKCEAKKIKNLAVFLLEGETDPYKLIQPEMNKLLVRIEEPYKLFIIGEDNFSSDLKKIENIVGLSSKPHIILGEFENNEENFSVPYIKINFDIQEDAELTFKQLFKDEQNSGDPSTKINYPGFCNFNFELLKKLFIKEYNKCEAEKIKNSAVFWLEGETDAYKLIQPEMIKLLVPVEQPYRIFIIGEDYFLNDLNKIEKNASLSDRADIKPKKFVSSEKNVSVRCYNINFKTLDDAKLFFNKLSEDEQNPGSPSTEINFPGYCDFNFESLIQQFIKNCNSCETMKIKNSAVFLLEGGTDAYKLIESETIQLLVDAKANYEVFIPGENYSIDDLKKLGMRSVVQDVLEHPAGFSVPYVAAYFKKKEEAKDLICNLSENNDNIVNFSNKINLGKSLGEIDFSLIKNSIFKTANLTPFFLFNFNSCKRKTIIKEMLNIIAKAKRSYEVFILGIEPSKIFWNKYGASDYLLGTVQKKSVPFVSVYFINKEKAEEFFNKFFQLEENYDNSSIIISLKGQSSEFDLEPLIDVFMNENKFIKFKIINNMGIFLLNYKSDPNKIIQKKKKNYYEVKAN